MQELNLPSYPIKKKIIDGKEYVFDFIRKKYLVNTPEEWVRQNFIYFLINEKKYPASLIAIEKGLKFNDLQKRADAVVYNNLGLPILLVEFKAPSIKITQETFDQISRYNVVFKVPYLIVSNGLAHYCCKIDFKDNSFEFIKEIPTYNELNIK